MVIRYKQFAIPVFTVLLNIDLLWLFYSGEKGISSYVVKLSEYEGGVSGIDNVKVVSTSCQNVIVTNEDSNDVVNPVNFVFIDNST